MMSIVKPFLSQESGDHKRVLEFGCSSGRMIRNLHSTSDFNDVWGVDLASEHIYWCQEHLKPINFLTVTMTPHLPFEDNYFDFIYAGSVFTHIDDLALTWLWELNRILKKGGILYITIHDEHTLDYFKQNQSTDTFQKMILNTKAYKLFTKSNAKKFVVGRSLMSHVFYNSGKLISDLEQYFEVLNFVPKSYQKYQSSLTLKK
jgi:ubiquinone/menaquinone biosynthesis C-methylase UbiE